MALPAVALKAKNALGKAKKAYKTYGTAKSLNSDGEKVVNTLGKIVLFPIVAVLFLIILGVFILISVAYPLIVAAGLFPNSGTGNTPAAAGEAAQIQGQEARIEWLYDGKGVPQTEEENASYLETFDVEYLDGDGNIQTQALTMHKKLKSEIQAVFQDLISIGFPIEWSSGGGSIRGWNVDAGYSGAFYRSAHCYGHAVDINVAANPCPQCGVGSQSAYQPGVDPYSVTDEVVNIWKKHGFYWGGDWNSPKDYMHFSYFDH